MKFSRRNFLKVSLAAAGTYLLSKSEKFFPTLLAKDTQMPKRLLGKTGYQVGIFSLGGQATLEQPGTEKESIKIMPHRLGLGLLFERASQSFTYETKNINVESRIKQLAEE